jgi:hypothetical protein
LLLGKNFANYTRNKYIVDVYFLKIQNSPILFNLHLGLSAVVVKNYDFDVRQHFCFSEKLGTLKGTGNLVIAKIGPADQNPNPGLEVLDEP